MKNLILTNIIVGLVILAGCAPQRNNPLNLSFNDLTAHYNAYFIAEEHIKSIESTLFEKYPWNYNRILPIYVPFDSTDALGIKEQLEDCIEKASIAIQRHPDSKWEFPSYILVGKARFYGMEFADAVEAFKYTNTKSENDDDRHEAIINLMRVFAVNKEYKNALAVVDYLQKEKLNSKNEQLSYMNQAYLHQERGNLDLMVQNLVKAEDLLTNSSDKARIQFIIGQVYQQLGFDASAYYYYEKSLRSNPSYELSFFTKLNMAQVTELSQGKDVKTVRKYFRKLLVDRKNLEYNDKIYYEMGLFEQKHGNMPVAITNFKKSVKVSTNNARQKGLSYLSLGQIYYDSLKNFELAKAYYDSTVNALPKDEENYTFIKTRQEILIEFVKQLTTIRLGDSLLTLAELPTAELQKWALDLVTTDSIKSARDKERKEKLFTVEAQKQNIVRPNEGSLLTTGGEGGWYFSNPSTVSRGYTAFQRKWKNRELEDNWRRSTKSFSSTSSVSETTPDNVQNQVVAEKVAEKEEQSISKKVTELLAKVPSTEEEKSKLKVQIRDALYSIGNIYNFKLEEKDNAITAFNRLLNDFPESIYEPEVLYQLYLLQQESSPSQSSQMANKLIVQYPESIYAKILQNPNYREESFAATVQLQTVYKKAYSLYLEKKFKVTYQLLDSILTLYPSNEFSDNVQLLRILAIGQLEGQHKYQFELDNFLQTYPDSELTAYVKSLIKGADEYKANLYSSSKAQYINQLNQTHYFVLIYATSEENSKLATEMLQKYVENNQLPFKFGNLLLSEEYSMAVVNNITDKLEAQQFFQSFNQAMNPTESFKGQKHFEYIMTEYNFDLLYKTKDLDSYRTFFEKYYQ